MGDDADPVRHAHNVANLNASSTHLEHRPQPWTGVRRRPEGNRRDENTMPRDEVSTPAFEFRLDHSTGVPIYRQLFDQVVRALRIGTLGVGDRLPTAGSLSVALKIDRNTVLRAYRDLAASSLVESRPGCGTFVTATAEPPKKLDRDLALSLDQWIQHGIDRGLDRNDLEALFENSLRSRFAGKT